MSFQLGERVKTFARIGLTGPTNAGKSYSGLRIAYGIAKAGLISEGVESPTEEQIWKRIAFIDTERGRGKFYINRNDLPLKTKQFYYMSLTPPYSPQKYIDAINQGVELVGPNGVVVTDSLSHAWSYKGGVLDIKENIAKKAGKNSYTAWNEAGAIQNDMIDTLLSAKAHTIMTMRSKMDYIMEKDEAGKTKITQVGLNPIQRDDVEYEFDITLMINKAHEATIVKDTTFLAANSNNGKLGVVTELLGENLFEWLNAGVDGAEFAEKERLANIELIKTEARSNPQVKDYYKLEYPNIKSSDLTLDQTKEVLEKFREFKNLLNLRK